MEKFNKIKESWIANCSYREFASHGSFRSTGGIFLCAFIDSYLYVAFNNGTIYTSDESGCDGGCTSGISIHSQPND